MKWKRGDRIVCKFDDGDMYIGSVTRVMKGRVYILFDDDDKFSFKLTSKSIMGEGVKRRTKKDISKVLDKWLLKSKVKTIKPKPKPKSKPKFTKVKSGFLVFDFFMPYISHELPIDDVGKEQKERTWRVKFNRKISRKDFFDLCFSNFNKRLAPKVEKTKDYVKTIRDMDKDYIKYEVSFTERKNTTPEVEFYRFPSF